MKYDICGIGNPIVDVYENEGEIDLSARSVNPADDVRPGGSVANSIITAAQLGSKTAFIGRVGDDSPGNVFCREMEKLNVAFRTDRSETPTGICRVKVFSDGERSFCVEPGAHLEICRDDIDQEIIAESRWLLVEGYLFENGPDAVAAVRKAVECARSTGCRVAFSLSDERIVTSFRREVVEIAEKSDLIFGNQREFCCLTRQNSIEAARGILQRNGLNSVITLGSKGAVFSFDGHEGHVPAYRPGQFLDTTGAGDAFAGGFLFGISRGYTPLDAAKWGAFLASMVVAQYGARLDGDVRQKWNERLKEMQREQVMSR